MNRLTWYLNRLSCMSIQEMVCRAYKFIQINLRRFARKDVRLEALLKYRREEGKFYFDTNESHEIEKEFSELFPRQTKNIIAEADRLSNHKFKIFNLDWEAGQDIDWHRDPLTGEGWPLKYWADIDFRNDGDGKEVRFIWELNRHQHLVTLGKAYLLTGKRCYALEIRNQINSWIAANPPHIGINWASPLELAMRLISWCWAYKFIEHSGVFSEDMKREFLKSIYLQAEFIEDNLSGHSSANNHLIGEACGLIITGLTFREFRRSEYWLKKGKDILFEEIVNQVYSDGVTKEQAFHYQAFIMQLFLLATTLLIKNYIKIPKKVLNRFFTMSEFIMNIMSVNGHLPNIGDSDNGMAIGPSENKRYNIFKSLLVSASILSDRGDFKEKGGAFREDHYWLFGTEGWKRYKAINGVVPNLDSRLFKEGGYAVFREPSHNGKEKLLIMDCGRLGYTSIAAHGHADLMSITLSSDGVGLLIDPGTYLYHAGNSWRDYFRGTSAHNTITINDASQAEIKGPFMWGKGPVPCIEKWETSDEKDYIRVSYNNCTVRHVRSVYFNKKKGGWLIKDSLNAKGKNTIRQYFHLPPTSVVRKLDTNIIEVQNHDIFLYMFLDGNFSVDIKEGKISPILGWSSDVFGTKVKTPTLVNTAVIEDRAQFNTLLYVTRKRL